ncbi:hypothetical protein C8A05DRAFT_18558, partial [Staphylotrichum tortipilum]
EPWASFTHLPAELRLYIWLLVMRQHRMIEVHISSKRDLGDQDDSQLHVDGNHLGRLTSGRNYRLQIRGGGYARCFSPLLQVNYQARQVALAFYRVHFPFPHLGYHGWCGKYLNRVAHLALQDGFYHCVYDPPGLDHAVLTPSLTPATLHPTAAK